MATTVKWKVFARLRRDIGRAGDVDTVAFNSAPSPGIFSQFSLPLSNAYVPLALTPTATYHHVLNRRVLGDHAVRGDRFPYDLVIDGIGPATLSLQVRLYPPNIVAMTLRLSVHTDLEITKHFDYLVARRKLPPLVADLVQYTVGVIDSGDHRRPAEGKAIHVFPGFHLRPEVQGDEMRGYANENGRRLVGLLLGIPGWKSMVEILVTRTVQRCEELNVKNLSEYFMLNKQGIVFLSARESIGAATLNAFSRAMDLVEIARVFQMFLDDFPHNRPHQEDFADYVYSRIRGWLRYPAAILSSSYTNRLAWDILVDAFKLDEKLKLCEQRNADVLQEVVRKEQYFSQIADRWWENPDFAAGFDIEVFKSSKLLGRLKDAALRDSIFEDLREAETSLSAKNYKAAVVMSGAAVEAMLLGVLEQEATSINAATLRKMGMQQCIDTVKQLALVSDTGLLELLDKSLREWRNFVHPGRALRVGIKLNEDHARLAVTAASALAKALR